MSNAPIHAPIPHFPIVDDCLTIGGIALPQLAARAGRTPFYAYDRAVLAARVRHLRAHLPASVQLHYAMKANPMPALVCFMAGLVDGLDVASGKELRVALDSGMSAREISFAGPGKSAAELEQAVASGILINVESPREIDILAQATARQHLPARVAVRVNPNFELKASGMKMAGGPKPFGVDAEAVPELLEQIARARLGFEGFHIFSGSQNLRADSICEAQQKALALAIELAEHAPSATLSVNLGGGFGIPYFPGDQPLDIAPIGANLAALSALAAKQLPQARLVIELGRYLVGEAGLYVCRVIDRKISRGQVFLVTDGGLHHHLAASGNFGQIIRKNYPVVIGNHVQGAARETASIVGPLCTPLDLLADRVELAHAEPGDLAVVFHSGAYGLTASPVDFLSHPAPIEILV